MSTEASFKASYQRLKHLMTCFVCYNKYSASRKPKWLLCAHHFCQECLAEIHQNGAIKCPLCRQLQFYSEETSIMPDVIDDLIERASAQLAKLKANKKLKRELETNLTRMNQFRDERETKLEEDLANFRRSSKYSDLSALRSTLDLTKSQVFRLVCQDRLDFYSDFQNKLELYLRNSVEGDNAADVIGWIEERNNPVPTENFTNYYFIRALVAAVINCSIENRGAISMLYTSILKQWAPVLKRFVSSEIAHNTECNAGKEIRLILAVQELVSRRQHPRGLMLDILHAFCENDTFSSCCNLIKTSRSIQPIAFAFYIISCLP